MQRLGLHRCLHSIPFIATFIIFFISVSHTQQILSRQTASCTDPALATSPLCWENLGIPEWLSQFTGPNSTCATSNVVQLAGATSSWSACFVLTINDDDQGRTVAQELPRLDAYTTADSLDQAALAIMPVEDRPRYYYVLRALSRLSEFFVDWNNDVSSYVIASAIDVPAILSMLDPDRRTRFAGDDLYRALLLGLPFAIAYNGTYLPAFNSIGIPSELSLDDVGGLLLQLVQLADVPLANLSASAGNASVIEASALPGGFTMLAAALGQSVQNGLRSLMTDLDSFRNATADGAFVSAQQWGIPQGPAILLQPLDTFLVSSILARDNWTVLALVGIDVAALSQTAAGMLPAWALSSCPSCKVPVNFGCTGYDANGQCGRWWYSEDLNSSFTLIQAGNLSNDPTDLITTVFEQGWTTGELLFENAAVCDEPGALVETLEGIPRLERPESPLADYMDSWFWRLMGVATRGGTADVDIVVGDGFSRYIVGRPGVVGHPGNTVFNVSRGRIDFACMSQLDLQVGWNWRGIVEGDFS